MAHKAEIAHHVRGRLRMKVPAAKGNEELLEHIRKTLAGIPGVQEVNTNPVTGSLVVNYDPLHTADFHLTLEHHSREHLSVARPAVARTGPVVSPVPPSEVDELARTIENEAEFLAKHSHTARVVVDFFRSLDDQVKLATGNAVDLKVLFPLGLAVYTFWELGFEAATPVWLTLGLFSINHFIEMHAHDGDNESAPRPPSAQPA